MEDVLAMITRRLILAGLLALASCQGSTAYAKAATRAIKAKVLSIHDGDTFAVDRKIFGFRINVRIRGIDTGETDPRLAKCPEELARGQAAKAFLIDLLKRGGMEVQLRRAGRDAYNSRYLFDVATFIDGEWKDVAGEMTRANVALRYEPVKDGTFEKPSHCPLTPQEEKPDA
jgi:endonuclease YncB( thermonuclease family)